MMLRLVFLVFLLISSTLYSQKDWQKIKSEDGISLWTKSVEGSEIRTFRAQVLFKENIATLIKVLKDVEKMHTWYDRVKSVKTLEQLDENEAIYLLEYQLPFPFKNRFSTLKGIISQTADNKSATVETSYQTVQRSDIQKLAPLITKIRSKWELKENSDGSTTVIHEGYLDPGGNVPVWAINKDVEEAPFKTLKALRKKLTNYK